MGGGKRELSSYNLLQPEPNFDCSGPFTMKAPQKKLLDYEGLCTDPAGYARTCVRATSASGGASSALPLRRGRVFRSFGISGFYNRLQKCDRGVLQVSRSTVFVDAQTSAAKSSEALGLCAAL